MEIERGLTNRVVFEHTERSVLSWPDKGLVVACECHTHQAHCYCSGLGFSRHDRSEICGDALS